MAYGAILGQTSSGGKRVCRLVVGTSASGWSSADCDYLCDGTDDQAEINAAIQALPSTGGEIVILDGTYNITATIAMNKDNVKLSGNGTATILKRMWNSSTKEGVINVAPANGGCYIESLRIDGNKAAYDSISNYGICTLRGGNNNTIIGNTCDNNSYGIMVSGNNNTVTGNVCNNNKNYSIYLFNGSNNIVTGNACNNNNNTGIYIFSNNNTVTGNVCNNNNNTGIYIFSNNNTVTGNVCNNNDDYGICLFRGSNNTITGNTCNNNSCGIGLVESNNNTITGNTCIRGTGQTSDYTGSQYTINLSGTGTENNYNLIACNNIMGKNYTSSGGTGNTFVNNKYN